MKEITIVIPVYNQEKYLKRCIDSVLNQTIDNYKILIINDGSTDNSKKICSEYALKYPDLIELVNQKNSGVAKTRNFAIKHVKTKYIMFIDNDDYIDKNYVETLYKEAINNDIVISGYRRPDINGNIIEETKLVDTSWSKLMIMTPWAKIFRTKFLQEKNLYFLDNNIGEDIYFNLLAVFETNKIKILDYIGYNWFYNTDSLSNTVQKDFHKLDIYKVLNSCYDELKNRKLLNDNYEMIEAHFIRYIYWYIMYSTVGFSYKILKKEYKEKFKWLKERFPKYKQNKIFMGINKPYGEVYTSRRLNTLLYLTGKVKLDLLFIYIYSKRK